MLLVFIAVKDYVIVFAAVMCDENQVYDPCGTPTEPTCENMYSGYTPAVSSGMTVEGCFCPPGLVRNGNVFTTVVPSYLRNVYLKSSGVTIAEASEASCVAASIGPYILMSSTVTVA